MENPPVEFNQDLSSNVALILAKLNGQKPKELAEKIKILLLKNREDIKEIEVAGLDPRMDLALLKIDSKQEFTIYDLGSKKIIKNII